MTLAFLAGAVAVILEGHDVVGGTIVSLDIATIAGLFVYGNNTRKKERERKSSENPERPNRPHGRQQGSGRK